MVPKWIFELTDNGWIVLFAVSVVRRIRMMAIWGEGRKIMTTPPEGGDYQVVVDGEIRLVMRSSEGTEVQKIIIPPEVVLLY